MLFCAWADDDVDYYEVLGLPLKEDSSDKDIKKQFRILSKKYHPDLNPSEEARDKYVKIQRAHEVLSDRKKRKVYDMKGEAGVKSYETQQKGGGQQGHDDIFAHFFGGGGRQNTANRGANLQMQVLVNLEDIYNGNTHTIVMRKQKLCKQCKGSGAASKGDMQVCKKCGGQGVVLQQIQLAPGMIQQMQSQCPSCNGKGKSIKKKCPTCNGNKVSTGDFSLEFDVEKGLPENGKIVFDMEADQSPDVLPGDVILQVSSEPHGLFTRQSNQVDLGMTMKISLEDALLGFSTSFTHLDGRQVEVMREKVTFHGEKMTLKGEGMPVHNVPSETGDLIITFEVMFPRRPLTPEQKSKFREILKD
jgi:DnaJ-class molecular chaperone